MADEHGKSLSEYTDDEIMNMDLPPLGEGGSNIRETEQPISEGDDPDPGQSAGADSDQETRGEETGGADSSTGTSEEDRSGADSTPAGNESDGDTAGSQKQDPFDSSKADQASGQDQKSETSESSESSELDYKTEFQKVMAPLRAAKREVSLDGDIEAARRLMSMGVDYSEKMKAMKPFRQTLRALENADLLDKDKINFLIDLDQKKPEAIRKLLKDAGIDPMTVSDEDGEDYTPTDHTPSDTEMGVRDVLDAIKDSEHFERVSTIVTKDLDSTSKGFLAKDPKLIAVIHEHVNAGIYDKIMDKVENERYLGRLEGLSDLEAYYQVGDAMHAAGAFGKANPGGTSSPDNNGQGQQQESGSTGPGGAGPSVNDQRRAAGPIRGGGAGGGKTPVIDLANMSDDEVEKLDLRTLR